jgi:hypothetical protein
MMPRTAPFRNIFAPSDVASHCLSIPYDRLALLSDTRANDERKPGVTQTATGTFVVKLTPQECSDATLGRMTLDKRFEGDLDATSKGEMLAASTGVKSSAGYVALERVSGALHGRSGTFVLQHSGTMDRGAPQLTIAVVPDSGTGDLTGLQGTMAIDIAGGVHSYTFDYRIATVPAQ